MSSHSVKFQFDGVTERHANYTAEPILDAGFDEILAHGFFIAYNSIVFRRSLFDKPDWMDELSGGHKALIYLLTAKGRNRHFIEEMAVKRRNPKGVTIAHKQERDKTYLERNIFLLENLKGYLNHTKNSVINKKLRVFYFQQLIRELRALNFSAARRICLGLIRALY